MPNPPKNYAITDFQGSSLTLTIDTTDFKVSAFSCSFALNEIPRAQCYVALGRDAASQNAATAAPIHTAKPFTQMTRAKITMKPSGEYRPDGTKWPDEAQVVFDGYFTGFTSDKVHDKFVVVANLIHWLIDLACSSMLTKNGNITNPGQLNVAAILDTSPLSGAAVGSLISDFSGIEPIASTIAEDVWSTIKTNFCGLASTPTVPAGPSIACGGSGSWVANDRALAALQRFEGGEEDSECAFSNPTDEPTYAVPLALDLGENGAGTSSAVQEAVARAIGNDSVWAFASTTFWDTLITRYCPAFGMAVVPMVSRALVIADLPVYRGGVWKTLSDDYNATGMVGSLERPQRGVGVLSRWVSDTNGGIEEDGVDATGATTANSLLTVGGCYVEESVDPNDGILQFVEAPIWLQGVSIAGAYAGDTTGITSDEPARAAGADAGGKAPSDATPETMGTEISAIYSRYAQLIYVNAMLRGRQGSAAGKLRFDIAPGSIVRIKARSEAFLKTADGLAVTLIACVSRVAISIDAESGSAATAFQLTHMRTEDPENSQDRTSMKSHPLFGTAIHGNGLHGAPLIPAYDL